MIIVICLIMFVDIQYSTILAVVYASYIPANVPSNMASLFPSLSMRSVSPTSQILNRIARYAYPNAAGHSYERVSGRPSYYIATCVVFWGMISALTGVCP